MSFFVCFLKRYTVRMPDQPDLIRFSTNCSCLRQASIDQDRNSALLDLSSMIENIVAKFFQNRAASPASDPDLRQAGYFFHELYRLNIWPISTRRETINLDHIQRAIGRYKEQTDMPIKEYLETVIARAVAAQKGLCLSCMRKGKTSTHQGNCHARLRCHCTG